MLYSLNINFSLIGKKARASHYASLFLVFLTLTVFSKYPNRVIAKTFHNSVVVFIIKWIKTLMDWTGENNILIVICDCNIWRCTLCL